MFNAKTFPADRAVNMICRDYGITPAELLSSYKYGKLPEARKLYCKVLKSLGARNQDIAKITGFSPSRVTLTIIAANKVHDKIPYFKIQHRALLGLLKNGY